MTSARVGFLCGLLLLLAGHSWAALNQPPQDDEIRILAVTDHALVNTGLITLQLAFLEQAWNATDKSTSVTVEIVNNGNPVEFDLGFEEPFLEGTPGQQVEQLERFGSAVVDPTQEVPITWRAKFAADIILGFTREFALVSNVCGLATGGYWIGTSPAFIPNLDPNSDDFLLDLRGKDDAHVAVVSLLATGLTPCASYESIAAHEFGHLLGGGHYLLPNSNPPEYYLYSDSRADTKSYNDGGGGRGEGTVTVEITAIGRPFALPCGGATTNECTPIKSYSDNNTFGDSGRNNANALERTAKSVANYVRGAPETEPIDFCVDGIDNDGDGQVDSNDPQCTGTNEHPPPPPPPQTCDNNTPPFGVHGWRIAACNPLVPGTSLYTMAWSHHCPEAVDFYEIYAAQPTAAPLTYRWSVSGPVTIFYVGGLEARLRVRSCGSSGCSILSLGSFIAFDVCSF